MTDAPDPPIESIHVVLESPPGTAYRASDEIVHYSPAPTLYCPDIVIHCEKCDGDRTFRGELDQQCRFNVDGRKFLSYRCANCTGSPVSSVLFALLVTKQVKPGTHPGADEYVYTVLKLGQKPAYGPPTPSRLTRMLDKTELENFRKGRRCEAQGLGIGAFAYYRRTVENQKGKLFDAIIAALSKTDPKSPLIAEFEAAKAEISFSKALEKIRTTLPKSLLIEGQNPLAVLHSSLSIGLHDRPDEECLVIARSIRVLLVELMDRMDAISADHRELREALAVLLKHQNPQA